MPRSLARTALLLSAALLPLAVPLGLAGPAAAESPAKAYQYGAQFRNACRPPLKYAAGACVRRCPAGYEDNGRTCRHRTMRW